MKKIFNYILLLTVISLMTISCSSNIDNIIVDSPEIAKASVLTSEGELVVVPTDENLNEFSTIFNWTRTLLGNTEIPVTYTLLVDVEDTFSNPISISIGTNSLSEAFKYSDINDWGLKFSSDPTNPESLNLFVKIAASVLTQNSGLVVPTDSVYSNYLAINVTPFLSEPSVIYIAGSYDVNAWTPADSPKLYSEKRNNIYEGYIYLPDNFKVCPKPEWSGDMGGKANADGKSGVIEGSDNIQATPGFYWMVVDLNTKTYKVTPTTLSIIGTINGNWDTDTELIYNTKKNVLSVTGQFKAGEFKFRQDKAWTPQFGLNEDGELIGKMEDSQPDPSNIKVSSAGNYTISLDLWDYMNPSYSITAQ